jgi:hypothetical protein
MRRFAFWILVSSAQAWGCVCAARPSAKQAWEESPVVFVGEVEHASPNPTSSHSFIQEQTLTVRVREPFKGARESQTFILMQPGNDCAPKFKEGTQVLFYLHASNARGLWEAYGCHRTRSPDEAADDLLFLRALPGSARGNRVSGEISLYEQSASEGFRKVRALPGVAVTISSAGRTVQATTNHDGVYEVYDLPEGRYRVSVAVPRGLKIYFPMIADIAHRRNKFQDLKSTEPEIELAPSSGVSVDFLLIVHNQISGHVLDPDGKPMKDVCVDLAPAGPKTAAPSRVFDCTNSDGKYLLESMAPGQYLIVANGRGGLKARAPFPELFYPGTTDRAKATQIEVTADDQRDGFDIRVPALQKTVRLSGYFLFRDGVPVPQQMVTFSSTDGKYTEVSITAADGSFDLAILAGRPGELHGQVSVFSDEAAKCPQFELKLKPGALAAPLNASPIPLSGNSDQTDMRLMLALPSCAEWPSKY